MRRWPSRWVGTRGEGFEDNPYYRPGELASSNAQLVERVVRIAREVGRDIASPNDVRAMLGMVPRSRQGNGI